MADTWITPERKDNLLSYINQLKKLSDGPVEEEDLYAAGFSESDLEDVGWFNKQTPENFTPREGDSVEPYTPTMRDNLRSNVKNSLSAFGVEDGLAQDLAQSVAGTENPTDGSLGLGLADLTPVGIPMGVQEGAREVKRGVNSGDVSTIASGVLNTGLNLAAAAPATKAVKTSIFDLADKLAKGYDPTMVRTLFTPESSLADLGRLERAKQMESEGKTVDEIWKEFGWWKGPSGWRFEVPDSKLVTPGLSSLDPEQVLRGQTGYVVSHPEFYKAIRPAEGVKGYTPKYVRGKLLSEGDTVLGKMPPEDSEYQGVFRSVGAANRPQVEAYGYKEDSRKATLTHELQHAVQWIFGEPGSGTNPRYIKQQFDLTFDNLPPQEKNTLRSAAELGRLDAQIEHYKRVAEVRTKRAKAQQDNSSRVAKGYKEDLGHLQDFKDYITVLEFQRDTKSSLVNRALNNQPELVEGIKALTTMGKGVTKEYLSSSRSAGTLDNFYIPPVVDSNGRLAKWASNEIYYLEKGEFEARIVGARSELSGEELADSHPGLFSDVMDEENLHTSEDYLNFLRDLADSANNRPKGFNKGGVVTEIDPVSKNEVPPGSEPEEVRDDIPARLSEGEYVIPADVVRFLGLDKIESLVSKAKESLKEMAANGRIGGETEEDDLPFSDEELMQGQEEIQMAEGGLVAPQLGGAKNLLKNTPTLPPWLVDRPENPFPRESTQKDPPSEAELNATRMSRGLEEWAPEDYEKLVKQRSGPGAQVAEGIASVIPFGAMAVKHRNNYLNKNVPTAIDTMLASGKDNKGNPLTPEQVESLNRAKTGFAEVADYTPGFKGLVKDQLGSIIRRKDDSETDKKKSSESTSTSSSSSKDKEDEEKNKTR